MNRFKECVYLLARVERKALLPIKALNRLIDKPRLYKCYKHDSIIMVCLHIICVQIIMRCMPWAVMDVDEKDRETIWQF